MVPYRGWAKLAARSLAEDAIRFLTALIRPVGSTIYLPPLPRRKRERRIQVADFEDDARRRIPDPDDVPTGALALATGAAIWSVDRHFWGCGIAVWTTERLIAYLNSA